MTSRCSRRRRYTTCKKKRSCKWVKRGKSHKGYCKKRSRRRQRGGSDGGARPNPFTRPGATSFTGASSLTGAARSTESSRVPAADQAEL